MKQTEKIRESPWARDLPDANNVECDECPLWFDTEHPRLPSVCRVRWESGSAICPHCAFGQ